MEWKFLIAVFIFISRSVDASLPCEFIETANITGGYKDVNQSFIYKSEIYPIGTYQEFDYVEDLHQIKKTVDPHIRGCICKLKPCIRLCCQGHDENILNCFESKTFMIINEDEEEEIINKSGDKYGVIVGRSCWQMYEADDVPWKLHKVG